MIRVLVVDDSALVRKLLTQTLEAYDDIRVVGSALDPFVARDRIAQLHPDVLTLDIEMPRMDGLSFLERLMRHYPLPVVVVSSLAPRDSDNAIRALALGAVDVVSKPGSGFSAPDGSDLVSAIRTAARARIARDEHAAGARRASGTLPSRLDAASRVLLLGASTGGPRAVEAVLGALPPEVPGVVVVQHMPEQFTAAFARRLDDLCALAVREARDGDVLAPGVALVAPGSRHAVLERCGSQYRVRVRQGPPVNHQRPSVDVLFDSAARAAGPNAVAALLTGMGADGARGMLALRQAGAHTIAQDEESSVIFGMPREAISLGAACQVLPLSQIAGAVLAALARPLPRPA